MKKYAPVIFVLICLLSSLACAISYEGVIFTDDEEASKDLTATALIGELTGVQQAASTAEPTRAPLEPQAPDVQPQAPEVVPETSGPSTYSVAATDFECVCQVDGDVKVEFKFVGDQLEFTNPGGGVDVYDKIGENTYKRSFMGYYILSSGSGDQMTETRVEEERSVVIILNENGYVMENYQGDSPTPCCFFTFTRTK